MQQVRDTDEMLSHHARFWDRTFHDEQQVAGVGVTRHGLGRLGTFGRVCCWQLCLQQYSLFERRRRNGRRDVFRLGRWAADGRPAQR